MTPPEGGGAGGREPSTSASASTLAPRVRVPKQARSRETRARILEAAALLIDERGFDATTMADIATGAGVAVGSLYSYFPDKSGILAEIFDAYAEQIEQTIVSDFLEADVWRQGDPMDLITGCVRFVFDLVRSSPGLTKEILSRALNDESILEISRRSEEKLKPALVRIVRHLQESRPSRSRGEDPVQAAEVIYRFVEAVSHELVWRPFSDESVARLSGELSKMIYRYLLRDA